MSVDIRRSAPAGSLSLSGAPVRVFGVTDWGYAKDVWTSKVS